MKGFFHKNLKYTKHEFLTEDGVTFCRGGEKCIVCYPETGRPSWCIMDSGNLSLDDPKSNFCEGCYQDIFTYINENVMTIE